MATGEVTPGYRAISFCSDIVHYVTLWLEFSLKRVMGCDGSPDQVRGRIRHFVICTSD